MMKVCVRSFQENLVEKKHHMLARSLRSGPADRELKPNAATRDLLQVPPCPTLIICPYCNTHNSHFLLSFLLSENRDVCADKNDDVRGEGYSVEVSILSVCLQKCL